MDTQKILKKRDKKLNKHKKEKREKHVSESSEDEVVVQPPESISASSGEESDHDQRDAADIKKISIVAEPGHSAADAEVKAESKLAL